MTEESNAPHRVQLSRAKGWRMPENTVKVDRTTKWGNPYRLDDSRFDAHPWLSRERAQACVDYYRRMASEGFVLVPYTLLTAEERGKGDGLQSFGAHRVDEVAAKYLRGKNLACWCALDKPCHADVLLELANAPDPRP